MVCNTIDILKLLNISLPSRRSMILLIGQLLHLLASYIEYFWFKVNDITK